MNNPVVVISGAGGQTAVAAASVFARQGASLALLSTDPAKLEKLSADLGLPADRLLTRAVDLREAKAAHLAADGILEKFGRVDILLHLVGGWLGPKNLVETPAQDLESMLDQHLYTTLHLVQAFLPGMIRQGWGRVIAVSSPAANHPGAGLGAYVVGKAAQEALLLTLAEEVKGSGVTSNLIQVNSISSSGKGTSPDEIVSAMLYLCSESAGKLNGVRIPLYS